MKQKPLTKADLIRRALKRVPRRLRRAGISQKRALTVVNTALEEISRALIAGESVFIQGLGRFSVKRRAAGRIARNLNTGQALILPAERRVVFKPARALIRDRAEPDDATGIGYETKTAPVAAADGGSTETGCEIKRET